MKLKLALYSSLLLFLLGCSVNPSWDGEINPSNKTYFSPPTWIQGIWENENNNYNNFKFTNNDFIIKYNLTTTHGVSYNERINWLSTEFLSCTEQTTTTIYEITILHLSVNIDVYTFEYVSNSEVSCRYESGTEDDWDNRIIENYTLIRRL